MKADAMTCDLCGKELSPLDAHMGYIDKKLSCTHIDCWNKHFAKEIALEQYAERMRKKEWQKQC
jgi:hypothetical protein